MSNELFILASRNGYRFTSVRGNLTVEDLWDLPLTSNTGFSLDAVAKTINAAIKAQEEESFVVARVNTGLIELRNKLELVKFVITTRLAENEAKLVKNKKQAERARLLDLIQNKENEELASKSKEELLAQLAALD